MSTSAAAVVVPEDAIDLLLQWISARISADNQIWLDGQIEKILKSNSDRDLHITLGLIPRKFGRDDLALTSEQIDAAERSRSGWQPNSWSVDTAARVAVLCIMAEHNVERFNDSITDLFRGADLAESIALYSGCALYPASEALEWQIGEGLRSNIRAVFESIAHNNPYPALHFDQNRWNHMVLKALFVDSALAPIVGLDQRSNAELATILCDYAQERWAAGREVSVELWRCVGQHASGELIDCLQRAASSSNDAEHQAGVLALSQCPDPQASELLAQYSTTIAAVEAGSVTWDSLYTVHMQAASS